MPLDGGLPPPPLPPGWTIGPDGHAMPPAPPIPLDGGLPPPPLPRGWTMGPDGHVQRPPIAGISRVAIVGLVGVLLVGAIGLVATRGNSPQGAGATLPPVVTAALPTATAGPVTASPPVATVPAAAGPRVTDTKITEQGNVCLNQTTFIFSATVVGAKAGDTVHVKITGPGLPAEANGTLGADGTVTGVIGVTGPVKGNQSWSAQVDQIAGKPIVSGPSQVFGFCPTN